MSCKGFERAPPVIGPKTHTGRILHLFDHYFDNFLNKFRWCAGRDFTWGRPWLFDSLSCQGCEPLNGVITEALRIVSRHVTPNCDSPSLPTGGSPAANRFRQNVGHPSCEMFGLFYTFDVAISGRLKWNGRFIKCWWPVRTLKFHGSWRRSL